MRLKVPPTETPRLKGRSLRLLGYVTQSESHPRPAAQTAAWGNPPNA